MQHPLLVAIRLALALIPCCLAGCAGSPLMEVRTPSFVLKDNSGTPLSENFSPLLEQHYAESGLLLLADGPDALAARIRLADSATRTLDLQYFIFRYDASGTLLVERLAAAAARGVRIRLLIDDLSAVDDVRKLLSLDAREGVEVRVFNPAHGNNAVSHAWDAIRHFSEFNNRMHNKLFLADNIVGVIGGRNIGDEYFGAGLTLNFSDLDLLTVGPVTREASASFDEFWNSPLSWSVSELRPRWSAISPFPIQGGGVDVSPMRTELAEARLMRAPLDASLPLHWARAYYISDKPTKIEVDGCKYDERLDAVSIVPFVHGMLDGAGKELLMFSPYFIPGRGGVKLVRGLRSRGVKVAVLTNSLASTDSPVAYGSYAAYRRRLLKLGVQLFEVKPAQGDRIAVDAESPGSSGTGLHAKAFVLDRRIAFVGSLNMDPRSSWVNTEAGVVAHSPELAVEIAALFENLSSPENSYRLELDTRNERPSGKPGILWISKSNGRIERLPYEPEIGLWRAIQTNVLTLLIPECML